MKKRSHVFIWICVICVLFIFNIGGIKGKIYLVLRNIPKEIILNNTKDYNETNTKHFIIKYTSSDENLVNLVANTSENYYEDVCSLFKYYPDNKTVVILYEDSEEFLKNSNLQKSKPPMGVYYASTIQILSPKFWTDPDENLEDKFIKEGPMVHEFTHLIVDNITKGNYPLWFTEGLALYSEYVITDYEWGKNIEDNNIYTIDELNNKFNELDQYLAYTQSFRVVKHIVDEYGFEVIDTILQKLSEGYGFEKAFEKATNTKISSLNI